MSARGDDVLLRVEDLHVSFSTPKGVVEAVRGVGFELRREKLGIVGESGSGKSLTGRAILGLTGANARVRARRLNTRVEERAPISPDLRKHLEEVFAPEVESLSRLLRRDLTAWCPAARSA